MRQGSTNFEHVEAANVMTDNDGIQHATEFGNESNTVNNTANQNRSDLMNMEYPIL